MYKREFVDVDTLSYIQLQMELNKNTFTEFTPCPIYYQLPALCNRHQKSNASFFYINLPL